MRGALNSALALISVVAVCILLAGVASTLALGRSSLGFLSVDLASAIDADYSVDPQGLRLAPLDEGIIDETRQDEAGFQQREDAEPGATNTPVASPSPVRSGTGTPTPTPRPAATPTATPSLTPTPTPIITPIPTLTPLPTPTSILTPTPIAALPLTYYLHNTPSPTTCITPAQGSTSHASLPANPVQPVAATLCNYDTDRDSFAGLVIARGGAGVDETDTTKFQAWRTTTFPAAAKVEGKVTVDLWTAMKGFQTGMRGSVTVYLRDFDGSVYKEITQATVDSSNWQGGALSWMQKVFTLDVGSYVIQAGHRLELRVIVNGVSGDDIWFAYDTLNQPSRIKINR